MVRWESIKRYGLLSKLPRTFCFRYSEYGYTYFADEDLAEFFAKVVGYIDSSDGAILSADIPKDRLEVDNSPFLFHVKGFFLGRNANSWKVKGNVSRLKLHRIIPLREIVEDEDIVSIFKTLSTQR